MDGSGLARAVVRPRILGARYGMVGKHRQERYPRPDFLAVLLRHHPRYLSQMPEVVHDPGGEQLPQGHAAQTRVAPGESELLRAKVPRFELLQVGRPQSRELGEQGLRGASHVARPVAESIVRLEAEIGPAIENDASPRHPIGFLAVDEVPDDIERTERFGTFLASDPRLVETIEQRPEGGGRTV